MDEKKKKLLINLVSSFLIILSICLVIALLINLRFHQDCATVIVGMLGVCATLYAPIAAFFFYDSWKEQHNKNVYSDLATEYLKQFEDVFYQMLTLDRHYLECTQEIAKILMNTNLVSFSDKKEMLVIEKEAYMKLSVDFSKGLSKTLFDLNKILQRITVFTVLTKRPELLLITTDMMEELKIIEKEITDKMIMKVEHTPKEFMELMKNYYERIFKIAEKNMENTINNLKNYIEA